MSNLEKQILEILGDSYKDSKTIKDELKNRYNYSSDISTALKDLKYFEYIKINENNEFYRTNKVYNDDNRKSEKYNQNFEIILNKVFTGKYLNQRLAHELINFIVADDGKRYIYVLPGGTKSPGLTKYVFHIIHTSNNKYEGGYELAGISKVDLNFERDTGYRNRVIDEDMSIPTFNNHSFLDVFDESGAHNYTYRAEKFYNVVEGKKVYILVSNDVAFATYSNDEVVLKLKCNPQHSIAYADSEGKLTYSSEPNTVTDLTVLYELINNSEFIEEYNESIDLNDLPSEQCFTVINDRTKLEDSISNQIAYFLMRDHNLLIRFLSDFLGIRDLDESEEFIVLREEKNIDLIIKSKSHFIIIENKTDSEIRIYGEKNPNGSNDSQLNKYFNYVETNYSNYSRHYYLLVPDYYNMNQEMLNSYYINGENFIYKKYSELLRLIKDYDYNPIGGCDEYSRFMFMEFCHSIEYLTWSTAKGKERTSLIRLKQRINELNSKF